MNEEMKNKIVDNLNRILEKCDGYRLDEDFDFDQVKNNSSFNYLYITWDSINELNGLIKDWAKKNNVNLFVVSPSGKEFPHSAIEYTSSDLEVAYVQPNTDVIDALDKPRTVMLIENIDKMERQGFRRCLLDVMNSHIVLDDREENRVKKLKNYYFSILTAQPMDAKTFSGLRIDMKTVGIVHIKNE